MEPCDLELSSACFKAASQTEQKESESRQGCKSQALDCRQELMTDVECIHMAESMYTLPLSMVTNVHFSSLRPLRILDAGDGVLTATQKNYYKKVKPHHSNGLHSTGVRSGEPKQRVLRATSIITCYRQCSVYAQHQTLVCRSTYADADHCSNVRQGLEV